MIRDEGPLEVQGHTGGIPVPVSISGSVPISGTVTVVQPTGTNLHTVTDTGSTTSVSAIVAALPAGANVIGHVIADTGSTTVVTGTVDENLKQINGHTALEAGVNGTLAVGGAVATNVASPANPVNLGAQAVSSENTAVTATRLAQLVSDLTGKLIVLPYANPENFVSGAITSAMTGTASTSLIASPGGSLRNYITQITVSNAHATVGTDIIIQDGNGGTTLYTVPAAALYGGAAITLNVAIRQPSTATAIFCANVTTGSSTKASASGYKGI